MTQHDRDPGPGGTAGDRQKAKTEQQPVEESTAGRPKQAGESATSKANKARTAAAQARIRNANTTNTAPPRPAQTANAASSAATSVGTDAAMRVLTWMCGGSG